jgi:predicted RND superfamily exporter protein
VNKLFSIGFWETIARLILRNRLIILSVIFAATVFFVFQWKNIQFSFTEANLLPKDHESNIAYDKFLEKFGDEGDLIILSVKDQNFFDPKFIKSWHQLMQSFAKNGNVENVMSPDNLKVLKKNKLDETFVFENFLDLSKIDDQNYLQKKEKQFFQELPFYEQLIFNKKTKSFRAAIYLKKDIVNTEKREKFITQFLIPQIKSFEKNVKVDVIVSGMPYVRTLNSLNIINEMNIFILVSLGVTSLIFFLFFRSFRATFISMSIVIISVMWSFGILGLLGYEISVLTAIIPPLLIVIGIPNCIFLINKYQQEIKSHGNQAKSLQRVVSKIGNATLMTNLTTAVGFATFIFTNSQLLVEFGVLASINILLLFLLCLMVIPVIYSFMPLPKEKHLEHLSKTYLNKFVKWLEFVVKEKSITVYITTLVLLIFSIIGIYLIKISGGLLDDMPKQADFFKEINYFDEEFNGIMPLEILVDTGQKKGVMKSKTLRLLNELDEEIREYPELSKPISILNVIKYSKQAYYNGNPEYYELPTTQEQSFILSYAKSSIKKGDNNLLKAYVDSTGQYARLTTFMKDVPAEKMVEVQKGLQKSIDKIFKDKRYKVSFTGKAYVFQEGTNYLVKNLILSLGFAILIIAGLMGYLFRNFKMIVISLIPNILPLAITAGLMGFFDIPLKPSTILVFSIAFGISVDDTIHFLAKYRQELKANQWRIRKSVINAIRESAVSMSYTSIVLFFGFSTFMISSFGGTVALGGLVSLTLICAMISNLILLPVLLLSLEKTIANEKEFKEPKIDILTDNQV